MLTHLRCLRVLNSSHCRDLTVLVYEVNLPPRPIHYFLLEYQTFYLDFNHYLLFKKGYTKQVENRRTFV